MSTNGAVWSLVAGFMTAFAGCAPPASPQAAGAPPIASRRDAGGVVALDAAMFEVPAGLSADAAIEQPPSVLADGGMGIEPDAAPLSWTPAPPPAEPSGTIPAVQISVGQDNTCAVLKDGTLRCWGYSYHDESRPHDRFVGPTRLKGFGRARKVAVSATTVCILTSHQTVQCRDEDLPGIKFARFYSFDRERYRDVVIVLDRLVLVTNAGLAYCMGRNGYGECGAARWGFYKKMTELEAHAKFAFRTTVMTLLSEKAMKSIALGGDHDCRIDLDDAVRCWGRNDAFQLGSTGRIDGPTPSVVSGLGQAKKLALGLAHSCGLLTNGHVFCWGGNGARELGRDGITRSAVPLEVPGIDDIVDISSHYTSTCAVRKDGALICWGKTELPHVIPSLPPVAEVAVGYDHSCARSTAGDVFCWGKNDHMQLGVKTEGPVTTPVQVHWQ